MTNQYTFNNYQQYSSPNMAPTNLNNTSPTANLLYLTPPGSSNNSVSSTASSQSNSAVSSLFGSSSSSMQHSNNSSYSFNTPRLRCLLSKSFEDDVEFCPEIPEHYQYNHSHTSPTMKKFNPYTATTFSPKESTSTTLNSSAKSPRVSKPIEIINPNTRAKVTYKSRTSSPATTVTAIHNK